MPTTCRRRRFAAWWRGIFPRHLPHATSYWVPPRRPPRIASATSPTTRCRCISATCSPSRRRSPASRRFPSRAASTPRGFRSACSSPATIFPKASCSARRTATSRRPTGTRECRRKRRYEAAAFSHVHLHGGAWPGENRDPGAGRPDRQAQDAARAARDPARRRRLAGHRRIPPPAQPDAALSGRREEPAARRHHAQGRHHRHPVRAPGDRRAARHVARRGLPRHALRAGRPGARALRVQRGVPADGRLQRKRALRRRRRALRLHPFVWRGGGQREGIRMALPCRRPCLRHHGRAAAIPEGRPAPRRGRVQRDAARDRRLREGGGGELHEAVRLRGVLRAAAGGQPRQLPPASRDAVMAWEVVVGIETHAQLATRSKAFSGASTAFGAAPNTQASAVDIALPGVLPVANRGAIEHAIRFGLAVQGTIRRRSIFARKNYFYPDLPKGYQISQYESPIVQGGSVKIFVEGKEKTVRLTRAHLEEDAGKSLHEDFRGMTGIDLNRAGTPLLEIVSEPELIGAKQAVAYARALHALVMWIGVCDGNMQEGSFR